MRKRESVLLAEVSGVPLHLSFFPHIHPVYCVNLPLAAAATIQLNTQVVIPTNPIKYIILDPASASFLLRTEQNPSEWSALLFMVDVTSTSTGNSEEFNEQKALLLCTGTVHVRVILYCTAHSKRNRRGPSE